MENFLAFRVVGRKIAEQHQSGIDLFAGELERFHDSFRIFPRIKPRNLDNEWQIRGYLVVRKALVDFSIAQVTILDSEWIKSRASSSVAAASSPERIPCS